MFDFNNYPIKTKLIAIFIIFKILPLFLLSAIAITSFIELEKSLQNSSKEIIKKSQSSIEKTTNLAISDSIAALDKKSQNILEFKTFIIANRVAYFLNQRDKDILNLSKLHITQNILQSFYNRKNRKIHIPAKYYYDDNTNKWLPKNTYTDAINNESAKLKDNAREFHKVDLKKTDKKFIPIYKEIAFYDTNGKEIYKVSSIDKTLKDISIKENTYCRAENYYQESLKLKKGEIYVSKVIGQYVPSPIIGTFTKEKAKKANIAFEPQKYGYAGKENPLGKKFEGIVRFVTPVFKHNELKGFLSFALDHQHIMNFTDFIDPLGTASLDISDASRGNYAFMWSADFKAISHPRDYFIVGYDSKTGEMVPGWIDSELASNFKKSNEKNLNTFLSKQPMFLNQSLDKKPNLDQIKTGQVGLDCRYLNFAPQCQGWKQLTNNGGYGSFIIFWSNVWKLTTAAAIPYYTGQYANSKVGFGFVTIGANVTDFHKAATETKENIDKLFDKEKVQIQESITKITKHIFSNIKSQINKMTITTIFLTILVIYIAIFMSNYISKRINKIIIGTKKLKHSNFDYKITSTSKDEFGKLTNSFNEMAESICSLTNDLNEKLYIDDLTKLKSRRAFYKDIKICKNPILFLIDIDLFRNINDYYGVEAGNFVLVEFAKIINEFALNNKMNVYRIGSDEFLLLEDKEFNADCVEKTITKLSNILTQKHFTNKKLHIDTTVSFTCGVSHGKGNLIEWADLALNAASDKKFLFMVYDDSNPSMNKHKEYVFWRKKIQYAVSNDNFVPYFQQIIDVKNPKNKKYEALIRMIDDDKVISPYLFLDIAKEAKLYPRLTKIMIEKTFRYFNKTDASFSVNLSIEDIKDREIVEFIYKKANEYNIKNKLIFELLESEEVSNFDDILPFIQKMKSMGIRFAIDDFGSGYSNFAYLLQIQPDYIKIDGSLIKNIKENSKEYHIVKAIVKFAKSLNAEVIAEHVSSKEIVELLSDFDIDFLQGFYFSEPNPEI